MEHIDGYAIPETLYWSMSVKMFNEGRAYWCVTEVNECHQSECNNCLCCSDQGPDSLIRMMKFASMAADRGYKITRKGFLGFVHVSPNRAIMVKRMEA